MKIPDVGSAGRGGTAAAVPWCKKKKEMGRRGEFGENFRGFLVRVDVLPVVTTPWESRDQPLQEGAMVEKRKEAGDTSPPLLYSCP